MSGLWKRVRILAEFEQFWPFYTPGGVAQNPTGQHTPSGPVFEQGYFKLYPDMLHHMQHRAKNGEICLRNWGLHVFQWDWHLGWWERISCDGTVIFGYSVKHSDVTGNRYDWELGENKVI